MSHSLTPPLLKEGRILEQYDIPILQEFTGRWNCFYVAKFCGIVGKKPAYFLVMTVQRRIAEFLDGKLSMHDLMTKSEQYGLLYKDYVGSRFCRRVWANSLPARFLPAKTRFHDPDLMPDIDNNMSTA